MCAQWVIAMHALAVHMLIWLLTGPAYDASSLTCPVLLPLAGGTTQCTGQQYPQTPPLHWAMSCDTSTILSEEADTAGSGVRPGRQQQVDLVPHMKQRVPWVAADKGGEGGSTGGGAGSGAWPEGYCELLGEILVKDLQLLQPPPGPPGGAGAGGDGGAGAAGGALGGAGVGGAGSATYSSAPVSGSGLGGRGQGWCQEPGAAEYHEVWCRLLVRPSE